MRLQTRMIQPWFVALPQNVRELLSQAGYLVEREEELFEEGRVVDYGYLVFSAAKAYEGFLKDHLRTLGLINEQVFVDEYFRIGRALNPELPKRFRDEQWLYDDVARLCSEPLARELWDTWKQCRNEVFHYRSWGEEKVSLDTARLKVEMVFTAIRHAQECEARVHGSGKY